MTSITSNGGRKGLPRGLEVCPIPWPSWFTTNSFKCPDLPNCSKWSFKNLHYSVVCPLSQWYVQYKQYGSCLIWSRILCTGSLNVTLTSLTLAPSSWILKFPQDLDWKPLCWDSFEYCGVTGALPLLCCQSSSNLLYSSIRFISCLISSSGLIINDSRNYGSSGNPNRNVLVATFSFLPPISLYNS